MSIEVGSAGAPDLNVTVTENGNLHLLIGFRDANKAHSVANDVRNEMLSSGRIFVTLSGSDATEEIKHELDKAHRLIGQSIQWQRDAEIAKAKLADEIDRLTTDRNQWKQLCRLSEQDNDRLRRELDIIQTPYQS